MSNPRKSVLLNSSQRPRLRKMVEVRTLNAEQAFSETGRCRQARSFIISSPGLMHRPQSQDARTYVTGFHKR